MEIPRRMRAESRPNTSYPHQYDFLLIVNPIHMLNFLWLNFLASKCCFICENKARLPDSSSAYLEISHSYIFKNVINNYSSLLEVPFKITLKKYVDYLITKFFVNYHEYKLHNNYYNTALILSTIFEMYLIFLLLSMI